MPTETATREFPTAAQWIAGAVTIEAAGFERYQRGGRPAALREDLRQIWLQIYVDALDEGLPEPSAWRDAWQAVNDYERARCTFRTSRPKPLHQHQRKDAQCSKSTKRHRQP